MPGLIALVLKLFNFDHEAKIFIKILEHNLNRELPEGKKLFAKEIFAEIIIVIM